MKKQKTIKQKLPQDVYWADKLATKVIERARKEGAVVTCRSAASTSGAKHIGNLFDVLKSYIVYLAVKRKGFPARFILTHDDRDPLRTIPARLPGLDGKWYEVKEEWANQLKAWLGMPYSDIPDPFDCCLSWAEHFAKVWEDGIIATITPFRQRDLKTFFTSDLYNKGEFDEFIIKALKNIEMSRKVVRRFQKTKPADYIPFDAICENCGKIITRAIDFDLDNKTVTYCCEGKQLAGKYKIEGCGYKGVATFMQGKLPWIFEWPAHWLMFKTTFEPFGKEHAEGSFKISSEVCKKIYKGEPPISHVYEFLLVNGEKMAARRGNAFIAQEILDIIEPEVFFFFYTKRSGRQRNFDIHNIHHLVDEFEKAERVYYAKEKISNEKERINLIRMYESAVARIPKKMPLRIPYQFAAMVAEVCPYDEISNAIALLRRTGHIKDKITKDDIERLRIRLSLAENWVRFYAPEMQIKINDTIPDDIKNKIKANKEITSALVELAENLAKDLKEDQLYSLFFALCKKHKIKSQLFFKSAYQALISKDSGPRLAPFILALGRKRVKDILEQLK